MERVDVLIVGAGFAGSVMAERFASEGRDVTMIDKRDHIAGNAYDYRDPHGTRIHRYGPHLFHTNSQRIVDYLSRFTDWHPYEHRVLASVDDQLLPVPINATTLKLLFGVELEDEAATERFLAARAEPCEMVRTSEDAVVSKVGRELYEMFFRGYTLKQWGVDPSQLNASVCARIPVRLGTDDRYFTDNHQALPADGYTAMFQRMLNHPRIQTRLGVSFAEVRGELSWRHLVWTGPVDEFFDHRYGALPYRSLRFELTTDPTPDGKLLQPVTQINYPDASIPYTRITEFGHLAAEQHSHTTRAYEYPMATGDPYYPVPAEQNQVLYRRYRLLAEQAPRTTFVGRLATYKYLNMDQVVGQALAAFARVKSNGLLRRAA